MLMQGRFIAQVFTYILNRFKHLSGSHFSKKLRDFIEETKAIRTNKRQSNLKKIIDDIAWGDSVHLDER